MQANRAGHVLREPFAEPVAPAHLVTVVDAPAGDVWPKLVDEMSDIVEQRGDDQRRGGSGLLGEGCALQRMGKLGDFVAVVIDASSATQQCQNLLDRMHG